MIMTSIRSATAGLLALAATTGLALAADDKPSQAKAWGLTGEVKARFDAKVVDILCELSGDCPENCGDGTRQLGLLRASDNRLILANKNTQAIFTGAVVDLLPYCNTDVEVDGLFAGEGDVQLYQVQFIREAGATDWAKTNQWSKVWNKENPEAAKQKGPWFRKDPRILAQIEENGYLGLGPDADAAFIKEWQ